MLINNKDKIIVLHNPKTGGRFSHAVCSNKDFEPLLKGNNIIGKIHSTYNEIKDVIPVNELSSYRIISMIRNPYDRFVSAAKFSFGMVFGGQGLSYSIDNTLDIIENDREKYILSREKPWFLPQSLYLGDNVEVLRYEIYDDWVKLGELLKFDINRVKIKSSYELNEEQKERIKNIYYSYDFKIFEIYGL